MLLTVQKRDNLNRRCLRLHLLLDRGRLRGPDRGGDRDNDCGERGGVRQLLGPLGRPHLRHFPPGK